MHGGSVFGDKSIRRFPAMVVLGNQMNAHLMHEYCWQNVLACAKNNFVILHIFCTVLKNGALHPSVGAMFR